jgi:hypothetical protein
VKIINDGKESDPIQSYFPEWKIGLYCYVTQFRLGVGMNLNCFSLRGECKKTRGREGGGVKMCPSILSWKINKKADFLCIQFLY